MVNTVGDDTYTFFSHNLAFFFFFLQITKCKIYVISQTYYNAAFHV